MFCIEDGGFPSQCTIMYVMSLIFFKLQTGAPSVEGHRIESCQFEYHIIHSASYNVPVLYFTACKSGLYFVIMLLIHHIHKSLEAIVVRIYPHNACFQKRLALHSNS